MHGLLSQIICHIANKELFKCSCVNIMQLKFDLWIKVSEGVELLRPVGILGRTHISHHFFSL